MNKPDKCNICGSTDIRPDDHELDPGWRCFPKGHVVFIKEDEDGMIDGPEGAASPMTKLGHDSDGSPVYFAGKLFKVPGIYIWSEEEKRHLCLVRFDVKKEIADV